jgi:hypothetical protein
MSEKDGTMAKQRELIVSLRSKNIIKIPILNEKPSSKKSANK